MSVYIYDDAIVKDLRKITGDNRVTITVAENVYRVMAMLRNDEIKLPLVTLTRTSWSITNERPHSLKHTGLAVNYDELERFYTSMYVIPIRINYLMDIWTVDQRDNDNLLRELIFYYSVNPTLKVTVPYGLNLSHNFNILYDNEIENNSDINQHIDTGEIRRQTISLYVDDAYLWRSNARGITYVDTDGLYLEINHEVMERVGEGSGEIPSL